INAIRTLDRLELIEGKMKMKFEDKVAKERLPDGRYVLRRVYITEEKGSDVNLATDLLWDAACRKFAKAVVVSGDTDLLRSMQIVKDNTKTTLVSVIPRVDSPRDRENDNFLKAFRSVSHFQVPFISDELLAASQLPEVVVTARGKKKDET